MISATVLLAVLVSGATATAQEQTVLDEHYVLDPVRVFYCKEGKDAVPLDDIDRSGVPDRVEDIAKQIWAAHHLFCEVLGFPNPLGGERYKNVTCIQVSLRDLGGGNGLAFDESQRARLIPEGNATDRAIVMAINCKLDPIKNITPAHETFHLVQYGTTYFKNSWYLEGMARWAEHALAEEGLGEVKYSPRGPWPQKLQNLQHLSTMRYDAEHVLWNPIARRTDRGLVLTDKLLGQKLSRLRYSDGTPVLRDRSLLGAEIMRDIVIELGKLDDVAFEELNYESWSEKNQRADENNPYIYKAVMDVFRRQIPSVGPYEVPAVTRTMVEDATAEDPFRTGSVWKGESKFADFELTVLERSGDRFKARFESKGWVREVSGAASGSAVSWKVKDVRVVKGSAGGDNEGTIVTDDRGTRIDFTWRGSKNQGTFTLRKQD
ncbi:hypothetical protein [Rubinisphaera margarita]|uniref:hypothetical protein n=1 Tax=Rubinisphaera margarita TaxID=2909586 RepID=UPI001EE87474|nr:hypothetical protein [Rubinisphaera margarita]MCG6156745.1 hypothetical protein [Rubinisphaera margarita]